MSSALCSMWISNTATTLMLLPIASAIIIHKKQIAVPVLMAIAYGASIGGMATPIGTPPNVILMGMYKESMGKEVAFLTWMMWVLPIVITFLPLVWLWLCRGMKNEVGQKSIELETLGTWRSIEKRVVLVFACTALLWITRKNVWGFLFPLLEMIRLL